MTKTNMESLLQALDDMNKCLFCEECKEFCKNPVTLSKCFHLICSEHFENLSHCPKCKVSLEDCTTWSDDKLNDAVVAAKNLSRMFEPLKENLRDSDVESVDTNVVANAKTESVLNTAPLNASDAPKRTPAAKQDKALNSSIVSLASNASRSSRTFEKRNNKDNNEPPSGPSEQSSEPQSTKMLIFLQNGEKRLITFTLHKESCTLREVLEQVNVPFSEDTRIQCMQSTSSEIDYFVSVGSTTRIEEMLENHPLNYQQMSQTYEQPLNQGQNQVLMETDLEDERQVLTLSGGQRITLAEYKRIHQPMRVPGQPQLQQPRDNGRQTLVRSKEQQRPVQVVPPMQSQQVPQHGELDEEDTIQALDETTCIYCDLQLSDAAEVEEHVRSVHGLEPRTGLRLPECEQCGATLTRDVEDHINRCHGASSGTDDRRFPCHFCDNVYTSRNACYTHLRMKHGLRLSDDQTPKYTPRERKTCHICERDFSQKHLNKHLWKAHGYEVAKRKAFQCPLCPNRVSYGAQFSRHLLTEHRVREHVERLHLHSMDEFMLFKSAIQEETKYRFRKTRGSKQTLEGVRSHYMCSQSGVYGCQGKGKRPAPERQIYKTGKACPAHMVVTETTDGVLVTFHKTHVGHGPCPYYKPRESKKPKTETQQILLNQQNQAATRIITQQGTIVAQGNQTLKQNTVQANQNGPVPQQNSLTVIPQRPSPQSQQAKKVIVQPDNANDMDDLEESITAAILTKHTVNEPTMNVPQQFHSPAPSIRPQTSVAHQMNFNPQLNYQQMSQTYEQPLNQGQNQVLMETDLEDERQVLTLSGGQRITLAEYKRIHQPMRVPGQPQLQQPRDNGLETLVRSKEQQRPVQGVPPMQSQQVPQHDNNEPPSGPSEQSSEPQSTKMLIFLQNGEKRLITFTLHKESCTLREVLEQVNVPFSEDTRIQCMPSTSSEIDYFVSVGSTTRIEEMLENHPERMLEFIQKQVERGRKEIEVGTPSYTELKRESSQERISLNISLKRKTDDKKPELLTSALTAKSKEEPSSKKTKEDKDRSKEEKEKSKKKALDEIIEMEERAKKASRKDYWLAEGILVKIVTKSLGDKYYKRKGVVEKVIEKYGAQVKLVDEGTRLKLDQNHLETVIPSPGRPVRFVNGPHRGATGVLKRIDTDNFCCLVEITDGPHSGRTIKDVQYEDISKLA